MQLTDLQDLYKTVPIKLQAAAIKEIARSGVARGLAVTERLLYGHRKQEFAKKRKENN